MNVDSFPIGTILARKQWLASAIRMGLPDRDTRCVGCSRWLHRLSPGGLGIFWCSRPECFTLKTVDAGR